jgi:hypothetical protein
MRLVKVLLKRFMYEIIFLRVPKEHYIAYLSQFALNYASNSEQSDYSLPTCPSHGVTVRRGYCVLTSRV